MPLPTLSRSQARELDRRAVEEYGMTGLVLMENAGRGVADVLCRLGIAGRVVICCGPGNNGGDGFVIARHLELRGYKTLTLVCGARRDAQGRMELAGDAGANYQILARSGAVMRELTTIDDKAAEQLQTELAGAAWIVDALLGSGSRGEPRPPLDRLIDLVNRPGRPIMAVDLPSGLDCDTGAAAAQTIRAAHTCTFVAPKPGLLVPSAAPYVGKIHVLDIGAPRKLVDEMTACR